jgi:hypothetical protein
MFFLQTGRGTMIAKSGAVQAGFNTGLILMISRHSKSFYNAK